MPVRALARVDVGAIERNAARTDRDMSAGVIRRQRADLRRGLRGLTREGFRKVHVLDGVGHLLHYERPAACAALIRDWLRRAGR